MSKDSATQLLEELLSHPKKFHESDRPLMLLDEYFSGFPVATLRPLFKNENALVVRTAAFLAAELGTKASELVVDVIPLLHSADFHSAEYAMEVITVCGVAEHASAFFHVVKMLESDAKVLRKYAMLFMSRADMESLRGALGLLRAGRARTSRHVEGLSLLLEGPAVAPSRVTDMLDSDDSLLRKYGGIAAKRLEAEFPQLIAHAAESHDPEVRVITEP